MTTQRVLGLLGAILLFVACAGSGADDPTTTPDTNFGVRVVAIDAVQDFHARATAFYDRIARRRFNTRSTYRDDELRAYFQSPTAFADYYADLAQAIDDAEFAKNRPLALQVVEFTVDAPGRASVHVRLVGEDARPLRSGEVTLHRIDRWERIDGAWWIVPGKL